MWFLPKEVEVLVLFYTIPLSVLNLAKLVLSWTFYCLQLYHAPTERLHSIVSATNTCNNIAIIPLLTLSASTLQNSQTHSNNSSAICRQIA